MSTQEISIRSIQHYMYCPHRWGLLEIDRAWEENVFVTKANLMHERVHNPDESYASRGKKVFTSVQVYNDLEPYNLYGMTDCLELTRDDRGISITGNGEKYQICIVEYKPTKPKDKEYHEEDLMQIFAQKLCVDYIFHSDCDAVLYYADVKKRIKIPLRENFSEYDCRLRKMLEEMRYNLKHGIIPPIRKGQKCNGCSMKDLCMPTARKSCDILSELKKIQKTESLARE